MTVVGYSRVSTLEQDPALQHDALTVAGAVRVFTDYASGATAARPQLIACLDFLRPGDTLAVWRIDRLGRSVADLTTIVNDLGACGIQFRSLTESIDTTTVGGELVFHIFAAVARMERRLISERTRAGLTAARARGRAGGRPTVMTRERLTAAQAMRAQGMTLIQIAATLGVGRSSLVRALAQTPDSLAGPGDTRAELAHTALELPEPGDGPGEPALSPASGTLPIPRSSCWAGQCVTARSRLRSSPGRPATPRLARPAPSRPPGWWSSTPASPAFGSLSWSRSPGRAAASSTSTLLPCRPRRRRRQFRWRGIDRASRPVLGCRPA